MSKPVPWPVRRGGFWLFVYENSLLLAFVVLSIFLRQRGSSESKPVAEPHSATGS